MDWFPLWNSLRIAAISAFIVFFAGIAAAYYIARLPRLVKGILDVILTLPLVLPPTVVGYLLLRVLGPKRIIGSWFLQAFGLKLTMTWWSAIFATTVVIFPLMYRTARGAFDQQQAAFAGGDAAGDLVGEVHVSRGVNEIQTVVLAIQTIVHLNGVTLDGDASFFFKVHVVEHLTFRHFDGLGVFQQTVGKGALSVVDVGNDAKVSDVIQGEEIFGDARYR